MKELLDELKALVAKYEPAASEKPAEPEAPASPEVSDDAPKA